MNSAPRLDLLMNVAFARNAFDGFDPSEFDVDMYLVTFAGPSNSAGEMRGFDGHDVIELTEHYSPSSRFDIDIDEEYVPDEPWDGFNSDAEADADVLANAGMGTDEDYGYYGDEGDY